MSVLDVFDQMEVSDPETARLVATMLLADVYSDAERELTGRVVKSAREQFIATTDEMAREITRSYVSKQASDDHPEELIPAAAELARYVSFGKALFGSNLVQFSQKHPRDSRGRFSVKVVRTTPGGYYDPEATERSIRDSLNALNDAGIIDWGSPVTMIGPGRNREVDAKYVEAEARKMHKSKGEVHLILADRKQPGTLGDAVFHATGSAAAARMANTGRQGIPSGTGEAFNEGDYYTRMRMAGAGLKALSTPGSAPHTMGILANTVGSMGPEAEKVIGPHIRRTAYRYRGTEKRPDRELLRASKEAQALVSSSHGPNGEAFMRQLAADQAVSRPGQTARSPRGREIPMYYITGQGGRLSPAQKEMRTQADVVTNYLAERIPDLKAARLSIEAGRVPPSTGVIIDADGDITSESMGFASDYYLPFDLSNLKRLNGGQYIRTRVVGGPTSEDIYTGLMAGARQIQIVSHSGVFTVDFDPDLRGGRRYTDKARQMVQRYQLLIDKVQSEEVEHRPIDPERMAELKQKASEYAGNDQEAYRSRLRELQTQERNMASREAPDIEEFREAASNKLMSEFSAKNSPLPPQSQFRRMVEEQAEADYYDALSTRPSNYVLNGEGYDAALKSLQNEFPYFIRDVKYERWRDWRTERGLTRSEHAPNSVNAKDAGHVKLGQLVPDKDTKRTKGTISTAASRAAGVHAKRTASAENTPAATAPTPKQGASQSSSSPAKSGGITLGDYKGVERSEYDEDPVENASRKTAEALASWHSRLKGVYSADTVDENGRPTPVFGGKDFTYDSDEEAFQNLMSPDEYLMWAFQRHGKGGSDYKALTKWLQDASMEEKRRFAEGLQSGAFAGFADEGLTENAIKSIQTLIQNKAPYRSPMDDTNIHEEIPANDLRGLEHPLHKKAGTDPKELAKMLSAFKENSAAQRQVAQYIEAAYRRDPEEGRQLMNEIIRGQAKWGTWGKHESESKDPVPQSEDVKAYVKHAQEMGLDTDRSSAVKFHEDPKSSPHSRALEHAHFTYGALAAGADEGGESVPKESSGQPHSRNRYAMVESQVGKSLKGSLFSQMVQQLIQSELL